jgi:PAS domain S-box-containing protein
MQEGRAVDGRYRRVVDLVELTGLLQARVTGVSIDQIAEKFEVSRRTAERMLEALRERFPELEAEVREGRKFWRLPGSARALRLQLPRELVVMSDRVAELEAQALEHREAQEQLGALADDALRTSVVGILLLDADFRVVWVNHALETYFGLCRDAVIGRDKAALIRERIRHTFEDPEEFERRVLATYADNTYIEHFECHVLPADGREERWLEHWSQPIAAGRYKGGRIEHYFDVSARVRGEQARTGPGWVESALSTERFAEAIAHSIRNPLASLLSVTESALASKGEATAALEQVSRLAMRMSRSIDRTVRLLRRDEPKLESVSPRRMLETVAEGSRSAARAGGVEIEIDADPQMAPFSADRGELAFALCELSKNAIDAMPDGGDLRLRARRTGAPPSIRFNVCDTGPGIAPAVREKAFEPFFTTRNDATGLGLPLAQAIARRHGGRVGIADAAPGGGGCVFLEIPAEPGQGEGGDAGG